jgi:hypothetical protein
VQDEAGGTVELVVVKRNPEQQDFILLPDHWTVQLSFGWIARRRRLLRDFKRLSKVLLACI